ENRIGSDGMTTTGSMYLSAANGGSLYLDSDSGVVYLNSGTNKLTNAENGVDFTLDAAGGGRLCFRSCANYFDSSNNLTVGGNSTLSGTLTVSGEATFSSNVSVDTGGQLTLTRNPTLAHTGTWEIGAANWNASDATIYVNPSNPTADSNIFALANNGSVQFAVDAEGDIFGKNLVLTGTTTTGMTTVVGDLTVEGNTTLGDASSDTVTYNAATHTYTNDTNLVLSGGVNGLSFDTDTLSIDALNNRVGIGTTGPSTPLHILKNFVNGTSNDFLTIDGSTGNSGGMWIVGKWSSGTQGRIGFYGSSSASTDKGVGLIGGTGTTPQLFVGSTGNVGIGTISPTEELTLASSYALGWEASAGIVDTNLYRSAANTLRTDDTLSVNAQHILATSGEVVFNETGADIDFRVEGDTLTNLFATDAANDTVGIGAGAGVRSTLSVGRTWSSPVAEVDNISAGLTLSETSAANSTSPHNIDVTTTIAAANTQNWTAVISGVRSFMDLANTTNAYTATTFRALEAVNAVQLGSATLTNQYGLYIADLTSGTNDYGLAIAGADTQALWIGSGANNTDAANGIAFGLSRDTNLYRSAADTLKTDDSFVVGGSTLTMSDGSTVLTSSSTVANNKTLSVSQTGATVGTDYAGYFSNTGAATTNVGLYATATGATNNYAAIFEAGNVGIGTTAPEEKLH
ncbi:MAG: hypothetical protein WD972_03185, partial [Candidatus Andersenbacteria bacterium]